MKWNFFIGACILASMLLMAFHAPLAAVAGGIALAAVLNWFRLKKKSS